MAKRTSGYHDRTKGRSGGPTLQVDPRLPRHIRRALFAMCREGLIKPQAYIGPLQVQCMWGRLQPYLEQDRSGRSKRIKTDRARSADSSRPVALSPGIVLLKVLLGGQEVCFNCLQPRRSARDSFEVHHLLPKRYLGLPQYGKYVPAVQVHSDCTDRWHQKHDSHSWQVSLRSFAECVRHSQQVGYGFAILADDPRRKHNPGLQVAFGLLPFITGQADETASSQDWNKTYLRQVCLQTHYHGSDAPGNGHQERGPGCAPLSPLACPQ